MAKSTAKAKARATPPVKRRVTTFKPIEFSQEIIMVKGGFSTKDRPARVRIVEEGDGSRAQFLKVTKQEDWLHSATAGAFYQLAPRILWWIISGIKSNSILMAMCCFPQTTTLRK